MINFDNLKNQAQKLKDKLTKSPLEQTLAEATSNENWNTSTKLLQEIADATYGYTSCDVIMRFIWKRLDSDNREWRRILKTLNMIEYLTKNGAPRCVGDFRDNIFKIRSFSDFFLVESGSDKGLSIRDKTKQLVDLLSNEKLIEEERENSKKIRERLAAAGGAQAIGSNTQYQGYSSDNYKNNGTNNTITNNDDWRKKPEIQKNSEQDYSQKYGLYETSGLDKYRTKEEPKSAEKFQPPQTFIQPQPFQEPVKKLSKPGEKWDVPAPKQQVTPQQPVPQTLPQQVKPQSVSLFEFGDDQPVQQPKPQQTSFIPQALQPPPKQGNVASQWGEFTTAQPEQKPQQTQLLPTDIFFEVNTNKTQSQPQPQYFLPQQVPQQQMIPQQIQNPQQQQQYNPQQQPINLNYNQLQWQQQQQQQQQQQNHIQQVQQFVQPQFQSTNMYQNQQVPMNYNSQQFNQQNTQQNQFQQQLQQPQQQQQVQQQLQNQKKQDDDFNEFQVAQPVQQKQNKNKEIDKDLLGMLDLVKAKEELQKEQQLNTHSYQGIQQPQQLHATQAELDSFQINYQRNQQNHNAYQNQGYNTYQQGQYR